MDLKSLHLIAVAILTSFSAPVVAVAASEGLGDRAQSRDSTQEIVRPVIVTANQPDGSPTNENAPVHVIGQVLLECSVQADRTLRECQIIQEDDPSKIGIAAKSIEAAKSFKMRTPGPYRVRMPFIWKAPDQPTALPATPH